MQGISEWIWLILVDVMAIFKVYWKWSPLILTDSDWLLALLVFRLIPTAFLEIWIFLLDDVGVMWDWFWLILVDVQHRSRLLGHNPTDSDWLCVTISDSWRSFFYLLLSSTISDWFRLTLSIGWCTEMCPLKWLVDTILEGLILAVS